MMPRAEGSGKRGSSPASAWAWTAASSASWTQRSILWLRGRFPGCSSDAGTTHAGIVGLPGTAGSVKSTAGESPRTTAPKDLGRAARGRRHAHAGHDDDSVLHHDVEIPSRSGSGFRVFLGSRQYLAGCEVKIVDQHAMRLAGVTDHDREELAKQVVACRAMAILVADKFLRHRLAQVEREAHVAARPRSSRA